MYSKALIAAFVAVFAIAQTAGAECVQPDDAYFASQNGGCEDLETGLVFSQPFGLASHAYATSYCEALVQGEKDDWRLPTLDELVESTANGAYQYAPIEYQGNSTSPRWTSNTKGKKAYVVRMHESVVDLLSKTTALFTNCVRSAAAAGGGDGGGSDDGGGNDKPCKGKGKGSCK